jgi:hypothetical protein
MKTKVATTSELTQLIEAERCKMYRLAFIYGYNDERTLRQSEKLDLLVVNAQKI